MHEYGLNINCIVTSQFLLTTITFLVVADGEAPPIQDEVECSTCKRSFAPKVLVKSATSHSATLTAHIKYETVWLTFVVWSLKVQQLQVQFDQTFSGSCAKKERCIHCVQQTLRCAEVTAKNIFSTVCISWHGISSLDVSLVPAQTAGRPLWRALSGESLKNKPTTEVVLKCVFYFFIFWNVFKRF